MQDTKYLLMSPSWYSALAVVCFFNRSTLPVPGLVRVLAARGKGGARFGVLVGGQYAREYARGSLLSWIPLATRAFPNARVSYWLTLCRKRLCLLHRRYAGISTVV